MRTPICDELGIEFPIFAFTHCRDVVVAVSKAGGFGVLGAVGFSPEQLEIELNWIDEHIGDHPYGVDIVIPNKYEGMGADMATEDLTKMLQDMVPAGPPRLRPQAAGRPRRAGRARGRGELAPAARLDRGDGDAAGRGRAAPPEDDAHRQRPRHAAAGHDRPHPRRGPEGRGAVRLALPGPQARRRRRRHHHRPGRRGRRPLRRGRLDRAVAPGRRRRSRRDRCSPPAASAAAPRSPPRWRWAARARGRARSG